MLTKLPHELLEQIIQLSLPPDESASSFLQKYSLVSPTFRAIAQSILFEHVHLHSCQTSDLFIEVVSQDVELGKIVKRLELKGSDGCFDRSSRISRILGVCPELKEARISSASILIDDLEHPTLESLILASVNLPSRTRTGFPTPPTPSLPSLTHLSLSKVYASCSLLLNSAIPNLTALGLRDVDWLDPSSNTPLSNPTLPISSSRATNPLLLQNLTTLCIKPMELAPFQLVTQASINPDDILFEFTTSSFTLEDFRVLFRWIPSEVDIRNLWLVPLTPLKRGHLEGEALGALLAGVGDGSDASTGRGVVELLKRVKSVWIPKDWKTLFKKEIQEIIDISAGREVGSVEFVFEGERLVEKMDSTVSGEFDRRRKAARMNH